MNKMKTKLVQNENKNKMNKIKKWKNKTKMKKENKKWNEKNKSFISSRPPYRYWLRLSQVFLLSPTVKSTTEVFRWCGTQDVTLQMHYFFYCKIKSRWPEVFAKKGVLKQVSKFTGNHLCQILFFDKVADLRVATLLKTTLWHRCFPVNFVIFLKTPFLYNISGWLLL